MNTPTSPATDAAHVQRVARMVLAPVEWAVDPAIDAEREQGLRLAIRAGWQQRAACGPSSGLDPDAWFPIGDDPAHSDVDDEVLAVCDRCPVRRSCLATALLFGVEGVWAGTRPEDRHTGHRQLRHGTPTRVVLDQLLTAAPTIRHRTAA